jgi:hypothetical protein
MALAAELLGIGIQTVLEAKVPVILGLAHLVDLPMVAEVAADKMQVEEVAATVLLGQTGWRIPGVAADWVGKCMAHPIWVSCSLDREEVAPVMPIKMQLMGPEEPVSL